MKLIIKLLRSLETYLNTKNGRHYLTRFGIFILARENALSGCFTYHSPNYFFLWRFFLRRFLRL